MESNKKKVTTVFNFDFDEVDSARFLPVFLEHPKRLDLDKVQGTPNFGQLIKKEEEQKREEEKEEYEDFTASRGKMQKISDIKKR
jgi:hypothetical protein